MAEPTARWPDGSSRMPAACCPGCRHKLDAATDPLGSDAVPQVGDITVCLHCTAVMQFGADLMPQLIDDAAFALLEPPIQTALVAMLRSLARFHAQRKAQP